jgi:hypothetical protein
MGRRRIHWMRALAQANWDADRILPRAAKGTGAKAFRDSPNPNSGAGATVTRSISPEKEAWVRKLVVKR